MAEETTCSCQTYWDKDGDYEIGYYTCDNCNLAEDACFCNQEQRCHLCDIRTPSPPTVADKEHADTNLAEAREIFRKEHADWHAKNEAGTLEEEPSTAWWTATVPKVSGPRSVPAGSASLARVPSWTLL